MATLNVLQLHDTHPTAARPRLPTILATLASMWRAMATRRHLARLDDRMLKDIGLSRADALAEAGRAPWDLGCR